jgi:hypothetical protein
VKIIRFSSSLAVAAAAAAMLTAGMAPPEPQPRQMPRKMPRGYASENNRKQSRAADRSKKQFLIKGVRP